MSDAISFHTRLGYDFEFDLAGRGLGFFGPQGSGSIISPGEWNSTSYIIEGGDPWVPYAQSQNVTYEASNSGAVEGETGLLLSYIPNYQSTLNIRFNQDHDVRVYNAQCHLYDGVNIANSPYGWNARIAEICHTSKLQQSGGKGDSTWIIASTGQPVSLADNPGPSGANVGRYALHGCSRHDWYVAISVSPEQVGSRTAGLSVYLEYL